MSTLLLHRFRYGELEGPELTRVREHLAAFETCSSRLQAQEAERAAFVLEPVPPALRSTSRPQVQQSVS